MQGHAAATLAVLSVAAPTTPALKLVAFEGSTSVTAQPVWSGWTTPSAPWDHGADAA